MFLWFPFLFPLLPLHTPSCYLASSSQVGQILVKDRQQVLDQTYGLSEIYGIDFFFSPTALEGCPKLTLISAFIYFWHWTDIADILGPFHPRSWADPKTQSILNLKYSRCCLIWATQSSADNLQGLKPTPWDTQRFAEAAALARDTLPSALRQSLDFTTKTILQHNSHSIKGWTEGAFDIKGLLSSTCWCL